MAPRTLRFAPLQPSNLQITSGPSSPASPLSPFGLRPRPASSIRDRPISSSSSSSWSSESSGSESSPVNPDAWTWRCHQCRSRFPLGVTRRCLHDGHYLCSGTREVSRRSGRVEHTKACSSEFDYAGWRAYSKWKRRINLHKPKHYGEHGHDCIFPSECRWSPEARAERLREDLEDTDLELPELGPSPTFDDILGLPLYGASVEFPEPSVSLTLRADHPNPLLSAPAESPTSTNTNVKISELGPSADSEPLPKPVQPASDRRKNARPTLRKLERSTEKRTARRATLLSPITEEGSVTSAPSPQVTDSKVSRPAFHLSTYLSKFLKSSEDSVDAGQQVGQRAWAAEELSENLSTGAIEADNLYVKDHWFNEPLAQTVDSDDSSIKVSPEEEEFASDCRDEAAGNALFDFNFEQDDEPAALPRRNAFDWTCEDVTADNIGIALSNPLDLDAKGRWLDEMDGR